MLTGPQLATAITAVLLSAILLGWILHWLWGRLTSAAISDTARITEMVNRLHEADRAREAAEETLANERARLSAREAEIEAHLAEMQHRLDGAIEGREAELLQQLREATADAEASMDGLANARRQIMSMEEELNALRNTQ